MMAAERSSLRSRSREAPRDSMVRTRALAGLVGHTTSYSMEPKYLLSGIVAWKGVCRGERRYQSSWVVSGSESTAILQVWNRGPKGATDWTDNKLPVPPAAAPDSSDVKFTFAL
jgi:hypothetical protein